MATIEDHRASAHRDGAEQEHVEEGGDHVAGLGLLCAVQLDHVPLQDIVALREAVVLFFSLTERGRGRGRRRR